MRKEIELWKILDENFDKYFSSDEHRINCICDLIIVFGFPRIGLFSYEERDLLLLRMKRERESRGLELSAPFWSWGLSEPRKEFIKNQIKKLSDGE